MKAMARKRMPVAALALILLTNVVVLAGAAWNRQGEPESRLLLTQRELGMPYRGYADYENSGVDLRIDWSVAGDARAIDARYGYYGSHLAAWLDTAKMRALGFDPPVPGTAAQFAHYQRRTRDREVLLVLELAGPAWHEAVARQEQALQKAEQLHALAPDDKRLAGEAKDAAKNLQQARDEMSRLFVVDAGLDRAALRAKYPDRTHYAILCGRISPLAAGSDEHPVLGGYIDALCVDSINLPADSWRPARGADTPALRAEVAWGRRLEPWVLSVQPVQTRE